MAYLLDANVFIQGKNLYYGLDICPGFWDWLLIENAAGRVFSIDKVRDEIEAGTDALADWSRNRDEQFFLQPDAPLNAALATVSQWIVSQPLYTAAAHNIFFQAADYYLVAYALAHGHTVVTHEKPAPTAKKVQIPNVCIGLNVPFVNTFEMLRRERARFVLAPQGA